MSYFSYTLRIINVLFAVFTLYHLVQWKKNTRDRRGCGSMLKNWYVLNYKKKKNIKDAIKNLQSHNFKRCLFTSFWTYNYLFLIVDVLKKCIFYTVRALYGKIWSSVKAVTLCHNLYSFHLKYHPKVLSILTILS